MQSFLGLQNLTGDTSLAGLDHSCVRNKLLEKINRALKMKTGNALALTEGPESQRDFAAPDCLSWMTGDEELAFPKAHVGELCPAVLQLKRGILVERNRQG